MTSMTMLTKYEIEERLNFEIRDRLAKRQREGEVAMNDWYHEVFDWLEALEPAPPDPTKGSRRRGRVTRLAPHVGRMRQ